MHARDFNFFVEFGGGNTLYVHPLIWKCFAKLETGEIQAERECRVGQRARSMVMDWLCNAVYHESSKPWWALASALIKRADHQILSVMIVFWPRNG